MYIIPNQLFLFSISYDENAVVYITSDTNDIKIFLFLHETHIVCLCWGFTAQSTQWGHVERGQFT